MYFSQDSIVSAVRAHNLQQVRQLLAEHLFDSLHLSRALRECVHGMLRLKRHGEGEPDARARLMHECEVATALLAAGATASAFGAECEMRPHFFKLLDSYVRHGCCTVDCL